jgi:class 3 adenylate cyclase
MARTYAGRRGKVNKRAADGYVITPGHHGQPQMTDEVYVGLDVHRATRIGSAGHGGQILLSEATRQRIEPRLPSDAALHRLGEFILKGLPGLESISQLTVPDLPSAFPPLRLETPARASD